MNKCTPKPRVAVIDDEHIVADTLAEILKMHGYEARAHYSGESALADAEEFQPDVVLSDVQMPKMDGIETAVKLRATQPACRIILFSASPVRRKIYEMIRDLGFEFLERPLHPREVLALLRDQLPTTEIASDSNHSMATICGTETRIIAGRRSALPVSG